MKPFPTTAVLVSAATALVLLAGSGPALAELTITDAIVRLDRYDLPIEEFQWAEGWREQRQFFPRYFRPAATVHLFVHNTGDQAELVTDLMFQGKPMGEACTTPDFAGPVIWYRTNPEVIAPGGMAMIYMRLREKPTGPIDVTIVTESGPRLDATLTGADFEQLRLGYVGFSHGIDKAYVYVENYSGRSLEVADIEIDGRSVSSASQIVNPAFAGGPALIEASLTEPFAYGSYHCVKVTARQGPFAMHQVRARDDWFPLAMIPGSTPLSTYYAKCFNTLYSMGGSHPDEPGWWDPDGEYEQLGFRVTRPSFTEPPVEAGATVPPGKIRYTNIDEPDAHESSTLPYMQRCGVNIMKRVEPVMRMQRRLDPHHETTVIVDRTYAPMNWFIYGEVPDVFINDCYTPTQFMGFDLMVCAHTIDTLLPAIGPRPVEMMLWGAMNTGFPTRRSPTPEENDMSVHYVMGGGAKGLHYFLDWNSYPTVFQGGYFVGATRTSMLWKTMGRMNAELMRLGSLLAIGHPFGIATSDNENLWTRSLLCGQNTFVIVMVNRQHSLHLNDNHTRFQHVFPVKQATVTIDLPEWFSARTAFEVRWDAVEPVELSGSGSRRALTVENLQTSKVIVLSRDPDIAGKLALDPERLAALIESEKLTYVTDEPPIADVTRPDAVIRAAAGTRDITLDLTEQASLDLAHRITTIGELKLQPGQWLGLFPDPDLEGRCQIVYRIESDVPLKEISASLTSRTPNLAACANNTIGVSLDGVSYVEDCSFKMEWNGGASDERLIAKLAAEEGTTISECYVRILLRDPVVVVSDEATNLADGVTIALTPAP